MVLVNPSRMVENRLRVKKLVLNRNPGQVDKERAHGEDD